MNFWKPSLPQIPTLNLQPISEKLSQVFWKAEPIPDNLSLNELNEILLKTKRVSFEKISLYVDEFVEIYVPLQVDKIHSICGLITKLKEINDKEELANKYVDADEVTMKIKDHVLEIDKLELRIADEDKDDFDLRVQPAKQKLKNAVLHLLETNGHRMPVTTTEYLSDFNHSSESEQYEPRSPRARDLLSFLGESDCEDTVAEHAVANQQLLVTETAVPRVEKIPHDQLTLLEVESTHSICQESLDKLNQDLIELHELMTEFHDMVHLQVKDVTTVSTNVDAAEHNVEMGNVQLKKANIIKAAMFPVVGAVVGGVVGGPIGLVAGMKVGSVTGGLALAGVTGTVVGYQGGRVLRNRQREQSEEKVSDDAAIS